MQRLVLGAINVLQKASNSGRLWPQPALLALAVSTAGVAASGSTRVGLPKANDTMTLVVYSVQGYDTAETTAFQEKHHIEVTLDDNSTGPLFTQIAASKNNSKWGCSGSTVPPCSRASTTRTCC